MDDRQGKSQEKNRRSETKEDQQEKWEIHAIGSGKLETAAVESGSDVRAPSHPNISSPCSILFTARLSLAVPCFHAFSFPGSAPCACPYRADMPRERRSPVAAVWDCATRDGVGGFCPFSFCASQHSVYSVLPLMREDTRLNGRLTYTIASRSSSLACATSIKWRAEVQAVKNG